MSSALGKMRALQQLEGVEGWELIKQHIKDRMADHQGQLLRAESMEEVKEHQGAHRALKSVLSFVESTIQEGMEELRESEI
jgi:hypothetical protein